MENVTLKATPATLRMLRLIAAMTDEKQYAALERVVRAELERLHARDAAVAIGERIQPWTPPISTA